MGHWRELWWQVRREACRERHGGARPDHDRGAAFSARYVPNVAYEIQLRGELPLKGVIIGPLLGGSGGHQVEEDNTLGSNAESEAFLLMFCVCICFWVLF